MKASITKIITALCISCALNIGLVGTSSATAAQTLDEQTITDAYVYLLGRALVIRQEQMDIKEEGIDYNVIKYNPLGTPLEWVNPNLDVTNNEAWIAVDDNTPVLLEIPLVEDRYYTAQICDEWGEVIVNINERNFPLNPHGKFAFVAPGSTAKVPADAVRIELHSRKAKMLARVELKTDSKGAVVLQNQFKLKALGKPQIDPAVPLPSFDNKTLIGIDLFDSAEALLTSALDVSPIAAQMQAKVRAVARHAANPKERPALDKLLRVKVIPKFLKYSVTEAGVSKNNWIGTLVIGNYGEDYWIRAAANYVGIWANARHEVIYFVTTRDAEGKPLDGSKDYVIHFPKADRPDLVVSAYWSLSLVGLPDFRAVPNPLDRYTFNSVAPPETEADGSMKIFLSAKPGSGIPETNRLPAPDGKPFALTFRTYVPKKTVKHGEWFPPAIEKMK